MTGEEIAALLGEGWESAHSTPSSSAWTSDGMFEVYQSVRHGPIRFIARSIIPTGVEDPSHVRGEGGGPDPASALRCLHSDLLANAERVEMIAAKKREMAAHLFQRLTT